MREIRKFVADDGSEFDTEKACQDYEKLLNWNQHHLNKIYNEKELKVQDIIGWCISSFIIGSQKSLEKNKKDTEKKQIHSIIGKDASFKEDLKKMKQQELRTLINSLNACQEYEKSKIVFEEMESRKKK